MNGGAGTAGAPPSAASHFISVWNTAGYPRSSDDDQISLPLVEHGTYDFIVSWGDGTTDEITSWDAPATTHTYPAVGTYTVDIVGVISGWRFAYTGVDIVERGDAGKLEEVVQWGSLSLGDTFAQFGGAANLVITATDAPDLTQTTRLSQAFSDCSRLESIPSLDAWDVSGVTDMSYMFQWSAFDQDLSAWDVSSVTTMAGMFAETTAFNQDLSGWDVSSVTTMGGMFEDVTLSTANYDALLTAWAQLNVQDDVSFHAGSSTYSAAAADRRQSLIADHGWNITDGGGSGPGCAS